MFIVKYEEGTMYYHTAMKNTDLIQTREEMFKSFNDNTDRKHWELVFTNEVPKGTRIPYDIFQRN